MALLTYLDLVLCHIEGQAANDDLAVFGGSCSWTSGRLHSGSGRLESLFDTTNRCSSCVGLGATRGALCLLLAVDDRVKRLINSGRHSGFGYRSGP